ncbi:MAG: MBL fold metallo-hydrolase [Mycolicibacterium sp.]|uniref:MBL fold metallo-hydrolase n=1 Tax=Mycolicibacterium sp. TaxID=2320850 RepID=UPI003D0C8077
MTKHEPALIAPDTFVLPATLPVPGRGVQYVNPFLIRGAEPLLVDTGAAVLAEEYFSSLGSLIDLEDIRWIFISHDDRDHTGGLLRLLDLCPSARVLTSFQAVNRMTKETPLPLDRMEFVEIGCSVSIGDRRLHVMRPPLYDSPATRGFFDDRTGVYYAVDAFGAVTPQYHQLVDEVSPTAYRDGFYWLNRANTPWLELVEPAKLQAVVGDVRALDPSVIATTHGPVVTGSAVSRVLELMCTIPTQPVAFPSKEDLAATQALQAAEMLP